MPFCKRCDEPYLTAHTCAPLWECRIFETKFQNDWSEVNGTNAEKAAARFCELQDRNGDYDIIQRGGEEIEVRKLGEDEIVLIDVSAESVPEYCGRKRERKEAPCPPPSYP